MRQYIGRYEVVAFCAGFALMAYELVAARILAPSIGSSIYVWTSVIGVMIAALAVGYAAGGWIADMRANPVDIIRLLFLAALSMVTTLLFYKSVLAWLSMGVSDPRLQGVLAAATLFMPTSFLLGMISPYLAKLRVESVANTGKSVAGLSALNSIGGIAGTFCAGFLFFSLIGSRETLILLAAILVASSWLVQPRHLVKWRIGATVYLLLVATILFATPAKAKTFEATLDTPTSHYDIMNTFYKDRPIRLLVTDPHGFQSGVFTSGSKDLAFDYTQAMTKAVASAPKKQHILMIGGGVFTMPEYLAKKYPNTQIDVIEIDPQLPAIAQKYFRYEPQPNVNVITADARAYLPRIAVGQYDIVMVDAFNDDSNVPFALTTSEYTAQLKRVLVPQGAVIVNMIGGGGECMPLLASFDAAYRRSFGSSHVVALDPKHLQQRQNVVAVYANSSVGWAQQLGSMMQIDSSRAVPLTDNLAPVEPLARRCVATG